MIEFIQDYVTKAFPPETFEDGDRVERSTESELYFVRLGVAGYVIDDKLLDQDHRPIERKTVIAVVATDRRFAANGRGGEVIGLDAPQRASSGPGNAVVFSGQPETVSLSATEAEQLRGDLAASVSQYEDHRTSTAEQIDQITADLTLVQGERETALADAAKARDALTQAERERAGLQSDLATARAELTSAQDAARLSDERMAELERQLAEARKPAGRGK